MLNYYSARLARLSMLVADNAPACPSSMLKEHGSFCTGTYSNAHLTALHPDFGFGNTEIQVIHLVSTLAYSVN